MPMRMPRGIYVREVHQDDCKVLGVFPVFTGEDLGVFHGPIHMATIPYNQSDDTVWSWLGPNGVIEANVSVLFVPYRVLSTFSNAVSGVEGGQRFSPLPPRSQGEWDILARRLLLEFAVDGNEYYGANPDDRAVYDAQRLVWRRMRGTDPQDAIADTPNQPGSPPQRDVLASDADRPQDEPLEGTMGPMGVRRLYNNEMLLTPQSVAGVNRNIVSDALGTVFGAGFGLVDLQYAETLQIEVSGPAPGPGVVLCCIHRYAVPTLQTVGFATEWSPDRTNSSNSGSNNAGLTDEQHESRLRALNMLVGGDMERAEFTIRNDQTFLGDYMRSLLFAGDMVLQAPSDWAENFFGTTGLFGVSANEPYLRPNTIVCAAKFAASVLTPYSVRSL